MSCSVVEDSALLSDFSFSGDPVEISRCFLAKVMCTILAVKISFFSNREHEVDDLASCAMFSINLGSHKLHVVIVDYCN